MRLSRPELVERDHEVQIRALVEWEGRKEHLWYSVQRPYAEYLTTERLDPFLVGLLLPAMMAKEDIHIDGSISEKLHWNLTHHYMSIVGSVNSALHPVQVYPAGLNDDRPTAGPTGVATGFSGGIDSFCVLSDHLFADAPPGYKVTHLIFNNVGSHLRGGRTLFLNRYRRLLPCAERLGLPFIRIDSNLEDFYPLRFGQSHSPRNASAALVLQELFRKYLYASAYRYEDCFVREAKFLARVDPMAIHLLSTERMECISTGSQYSRVEKTAKVAEIPLCCEYLDVCYDGIDSQGAGNCSLCQKCARTLLTLEILGKTHLYEKIFSLDQYRRIRRRFMVKAIAGDEPFLKEITRLARAKGYSFPLSVRIMGVSRRIRKQITDKRPWHRRRE